MSNIAIRENDAPALPVQQITEDYVIKCLQSQGLNLSPQQSRQFIDICKAYQLNPIKKEIYAVAYGNNFNIIVGYETYLKRAERTGLLEGWKTWLDKDAIGEKACIEIKRKDRSMMFYHEVYMSEYNEGKSIWKTKPYTMLKKVAIAQGFRLCFPDELGGIPYTQEEVDSFGVNTEQMRSKLSKYMSDYGINTDDLKISFGKFHNISSADTSTYVNIVASDTSFEKAFNDWQKKLMNDDVVDIESEASDEKL